MAKFRVNWRTILFNLPIIVAMVRQMQLSWPEVKKAALSAVEADPAVADFISAADTVYRMLVTRR